MHAESLDVSKYLVLRRHLVHRHTLHGSASTKLDRPVLQPVNVVSSPAVYVLVPNMDRTLYLQAMPAQIDRSKKPS